MPLQQPMTNHDHHTYRPESAPVPTGHEHHMDHSVHAMPAAQMAHDQHARHAEHGEHADVFRRRFWICLILSIPVVLYSEMVQDWLGFSMPDFPGSGAIPPVLGTIIFLYGGRVFLEGGWDELKTRKPGMMLLISLAILVAFIASLATTLDLLDLEFWWELALLITIMLLGHWLEIRAIGQARGALTALAALLPDEAERITEHGTETVPLSSLQVGDVVLVRPGGRVPADGAILDGQAEIDESMITGESRLVEKSIGDRVIAGTVATGASIRVKVEAVGEETALAGIQRLVLEAQESRSRAQTLADRFAAGLFFVALGAGIITFLIWVALGETDEAVTRTVTVLVISCPHALGLAIPLVVALSTGIAAKQGILVKDHLALERMRLVDDVLFDKTGTLTKGEHAVTGIFSLDGSEDQLLAVAAAAELDSEHPLARAIARTATERSVALPHATGFRALAGRGVEASVDGVPIAVGGPALLRERHVQIPPNIAEHMQPWQERGAAVLYVLCDNQIIGAVALEDEIRPESREAIAELHKQGVHVVMITGDARNVAEAVAKDLGVDEVFAEVLPEEKEGKVVELQQRGGDVAMVGDGVNDAPALARADVGIAIGAGTDVAIESAGVILATSDPRAVVGVRKLSNAAYRKMIENLAWAAGYNIIAIPLAAGVLAPIGFTLPPAVGAILMSASTIVVAFNAQLLRRVDLRP